MYNIHSVGTFGDIRQEEGGCTYERNNTSARHRSDKDYDPVIRWISE